MGARSRCACANAGDSVGRAGPERRQRYSYIAAQARLGRRHETGAALVLDQHKVKTAPANRVQDLDIFAAGQAVNALNAGGLQRGGQVVSDSRHHQQLAAQLLSSR